VKLRFPHIHEGGYIGERSEVIRAHNIHEWLEAINFGQSTKLENTIIPQI
jgi:hypothetical protein